MQDRIPPPRSALSRFMAGGFTLQRVLLIGTAVFVGIIILYPIAMVMLSSFWQTITNSTFTFRWYQAVYTDPATYDALMNTIVVVVGVTSLALVVGLTLAWIVVRTDVPFARTLETVVILPFLISPLIGALAWSWIASPSNGYLNVFLRWAFDLDTFQGPIDIYSLGGIIWVLGIFCVPYIFMFAATALKSVDPALEEAARIAGSNPLSTFWRVTIHLITPAVLSGVLFTATIAAGNFDVAGILGIRGNIWVFSTVIYSTMSEPPNPPRAAALSSLLIAATMVALWAQLRIMGLRQFVTVSGKGWRGTRIRLGRWRPVAFGFCILYLTVTVIAPFAAIVYASLAPPWGGPMTLDSYRLVLNGYNTTWTGVRTSALLSVTSATVTVILGALLAYMLIRTRYRFRRPLEYIAFLPAAVPGTALAVGILVAWIKPPLVLYGTVWILIVGYIAHFIPFGVRAAAASLHQYSPELEESSRVSGASWITTIRNIVVPLITPGLTTGWIILFVITLRELPTSIILYTPGRETISVVIYGMWEEGHAGAVAAFAVFVTLISLVGIVFARYVIGGLAQRRAEGRLRAPRRAAAPADANATN